MSILDCFPFLPAKLIPGIRELAVADSRAIRAAAQRLLAKHGAAFDLAVESLGDSKSEIRASAANWLSAIGQADAIPALRRQLKQEKGEVVRAAILASLESLGDDIAPDLSPQVRLAEAKKGLSAKRPASLAWLDLGLVPDLKWADETPVDPQIVQWWVVLADKLKNPDGSGIIDRYLSLLNPVSAATLGRFALDVWVAKDTQRPPESESHTHALVAGLERWQSHQAWARRARVKQYAEPEYIDKIAAKTLEQHIQDEYLEHQSIYVRTAAPNRGLLALTTRMPGAELAEAVQSYIRHHSVRRAQVDSLMHALYGNGDAPAIQLLLSVARRYKQRTVQETASKLAESLAEKLGWTADELADRTVPTAGFGDDRLLRLSFGSREFLGRATAEGLITLSDIEGKTSQGAACAESRR